MVMQQEKHGKLYNLPLILAFTIIGVVAVLYFVHEPFREGMKTAYEVLTSDDDERIHDWVSQFGLIGPLVIILVMVIQMFTFVVPNILIMMIAIISYGPVWGGVLSLVGVFASSSVGYYVGSRLSPVTIKKFVSSKTQTKISSFLHDYGIAAIIIFRLSSFSSDALGFVAGILKMGYRRFILSTLVGITPLIILLCIYGRKGNIEKALIWIAAASLTMFIVYVIYDKKRKHRQHPQRKTKTV
jgi:uncharacterized membrane protein YdjX (TVP38/TMEM64 family)